MEREGKPNNLVFFNLPAAGHVNPSLPLIAELTRRGNRVLYYTGDQFRTQIERQGAEFRSYGAHLSYDHSRLPTNLLRIAAVLARATEDLLPFALSELRRERPRGGGQRLDVPLGPFGRQSAGNAGGSVADRAPDRPRSPT